MKKKRSIFILSLLLVAAGVMAQTPSLVPAMIVHSTDGQKQVVGLNDTNVTDLVVLQSGNSLSVDIPEAQINGIRSIAFALVDASEVPMDVESTEDTLVRSVEKVLRDGQVFIRLQTEKGGIIEYDIRGNKVITK